MPLNGLNESTSFVIPIVKVGVVGALPAAALGRAGRAPHGGGRAGARHADPAAAVDSRGRMRIMDGSLGGPSALVSESVAPRQPVS